MKKGKGLFAEIKNIIIFLVVCGLIVAFIAKFDWNIVSAVSWVLNKAWEIILNIANMFTGSEAFQKIVS